MQEIYEFCAWERYKIARALSHEPEYGLSRLDESDYTPRCSTFSPHRLRTKGQFDALKIKFETLKSKFEKPKASPSIFYFLHNEDEVTLFYGDIVIGILSYHSSYQHGDGQYSEALQVKYPNSEIAKQLLEKADEIWQKTLSNKAFLSAEEKYKCLGRILWFLAFACPLHKGSAATSEMVFHLLCEKLGLPLLPIKSDRSWDICAMYTESPEEFAECFYRDFIYNNISEKDYSKYKLPRLTEDNTEALQQEVSRLLNTYQAFLKTAKENDTDFQLFEGNLKGVIDLQDPYGLGLYHYYYLYLTRNAVSIEQDIWEGCYALPSLYLNQGEHLFFDSLKNSKISPFMFLADGGYWRSYRESTTEKEMLSQGISILQRMLENKKMFDSVSLRLLEKILIHAELVYGEYNPTLKQKIKNFQVKIKAGEILVLELIAVDLSSIFRDIKKEDNIDFSIDHLMYLVEYSDCDYDYYEKIPFEKWLEKHGSLPGKSLFEKTLECHNERILLLFIPTIQTNNIEELINAIIAIDSKENRLFLFSQLFEHSSFTEEKMRCFMRVFQKQSNDQSDQPELMLLSLCQVKSSLDKDKTDCFFEMFPGDLKAAIEHKDASGKTPLYYAVLHKKIFIVERLVKEHVALNNAFSTEDNNIHKKIADFLCLSKENEVKAKILLYLKDEAFQMIYNEVCHYFYDSTRKNFYEGLNEALSSSKKFPKISFYSMEDNTSRLKNNFLKILCEDIKKGIHTGQTLSCLEQVTGFEREDYEMLMAVASNLDKTSKLKTLLQEKTAISSPSLKRNSTT